MAEVCHDPAGAWLVITPLEHTYSTTYTPEGKSIPSSAIEQAI
jgi:hypothetical protein